jgi:hypothetical protein
MMPVTRATARVTSAIVSRIIRTPFLFSAGAMDIGERDLNRNLTMQIIIKSNPNFPDIGLLLR